MTDGVDGCLVPEGPQAAEGIAQALIRLGRDAALRRRLADGARRSFEAKFTVEAMVDRLEPAFRRAVAARQAQETG